MKRIVFAVLALLTSTALARAEDPIVETDYDWTGFYIGANAGYAFSMSDVDVENVGTSGFPQGILNDLDQDSFDTDSNALFGGVQIGYGFRMDQVVFGLEADAQYADADESEEFLVGGRGFRANQDLEYFATLRGRLGYAITEGALFYVTGGAAVAKVDLDAVLTTDGFNGDDWVAGDSSTEWGWTAGVGTEIMLDNNIGLKAEYLYIDLANKSFTAPGNLNPGTEIVDFNFDNEYQLVRLGLNWYFR